jgi:hypothetical protein
MILRSGGHMAHITLNQGLKRIEVSKLEIENELGSGFIN